MKVNPLTKVFLPENSMRPLPTTLSENKFFLFGKEFKALFFSEENNFVSQPIIFNGLNCQDKLELTISVGKKSGGVKLYFEYIEPNNPSSFHFMTIENTNVEPLLWKDLSRKRRTGDIKDRFVDWPIETADLFLDSVATKLSEKSEIPFLNTKHGRFPRDKNVIHFLDLMRTLEWNKNERTLSKKRIFVMADCFFSTIKNPFFYDSYCQYEKQFEGLSGKTLASFCLVIGKIPDKNQLKTLKEQEKPLKQKTEEFVL